MGSEKGGKVPDNQAAASNGHASQRGQCHDWPERFDRCSDRLGLAGALGPSSAVHIRDM